MNKLNKTWKINIIAMHFCIAAAIVLIIFPYMHLAELLVMSHQELATVVHQMPYFGFVILLATWIFWLKAFDATLIGCRVLNSIMFLAIGTTILFTILFYPQLSYWGIPWFVPLLVCVLCLQGFSLRLYFLQKKRKATDTQEDGQAV